MTTPPTYPDGSQFVVGCERRECTYHENRPAPAKPFEETCPACGEFGTLINWGRLIVRTQDVDDALIAEFVETVDGFSEPGQPIDWQDIFERIEGRGGSKHDDGGLTFGDEWDTPAQNKIKRAVRAALKEG